MPTLKNSLHLVAALCFFGSIQARAEDPVCRGAISAIQQLTSQDQESMMKVTAEYQVKLADGFLHNDQSGVLFRENKVVGDGHGGLV